MWIKGALEPFEKEIDGVLGRVLDRGLALCDAVIVDIRLSHDDLAVPSYSKPSALACPAEMVTRLPKGERGVPSSLGEGEERSAESIDERKLWPGMVAD